MPYTYPPDDFQPRKSSKTDRCKTNKCSTPCADFDISAPPHLKNTFSEFAKSSPQNEDPTQWNQREWMLSRQVCDLQNQLGCLQEKLMIVTEERNKLLEEKSSGRNRRDVEGEMESLKQEVRQYKYKEIRLLSHYNLLEEENANLNKQLAELRKAQVDAEIKNRQGIVIAKKKKSKTGKPEEDGCSHERPPDIEELEEEVARLKILTITKGEQCSTLREVLSSTKKTCEESVKNMKMRHEAEKQNLMREIKELKDEIRALRGESKSLVKVGTSNQPPPPQQQQNLQTLYKYQDMLTQFEQCEKEKRILMQMLYTAQEQKIALTKKLEHQAKIKPTKR